MIKPDLWEHVVEPVLHADYNELFTRQALLRRTSSSTRPASS